MNSTHNKLSNQKNALLDYIGVLTAEQLIEKPVSEEQTLVDQVCKESCKVSPFNASIEDNNEALAQTNGNTNKQNINNASNNNVNNSDRNIEVCVFLVSGLKLAISTDKINDIIDIPKEIKFPDRPLQQSVFGLDVDSSTVTVINTSILVMPKRKGNKPNKMIMIKGANVGFTCDDVIESLNLDKNNICWRTDSTKRKWLAGTVVTRQMALLDVDKIIEGY